MAGRPIGCALPDKDCNPYMVASTRVMPTSKESTTWCCLCARDASSNETKKLKNRNELVLKGAKESLNRKPLLTWGKKRGVLARNELMEQEVFSPMGVMVVLEE